MINLELALEVKRDKAASYWLKSTIDRLMERDICDVQGELEMLNLIFNHKGE